MDVTPFLPHLAIPSLSFFFLTALCASATLVDLKFRRIPNFITVTGLLLGLVLGAWHGGWAGLTNSALGFLAGLALLLPGFMLRMTGGGDVKLLAAVGAFLGPSLTLPAFVLYILGGLVLAVLYGLYGSWSRGWRSPFGRFGLMFRTLMRTGRFAYIPPPADEAMGQRLPMAPAIAFGAIATPLLFSHG